MRRWFCFALCAVYLSALPVYGNSAPSYWDASPYSDILAVERDSPIVIDREHLTFDFSREEDFEGRDAMSPVGRVMAEYQMTNPGTETLAVQMAFPFVAKIYSLAPSDIVIRADGQAVPYEIYIDSAVADLSQDSIKDYLSEHGAIGRISSQERQLPGFDLDQEARLYRFSVSAREEERLDFKISFHADPRHTLLIGSGYDFTSADQEKMSLGFRAREGGQAELLVLGRDLEFTYKVLAEDEKEADPRLYQAEIVQDTVMPREYLLDGLHRELLSRELDPETASAISDTQLLNSCLHFIEQNSLSYGFAFLDDAVSTLYRDRIFTLVYQVEFPPQSTRSVTVSYLTEGTMDRRETVTPTYGYTYLLSPARSWADFGSLEVEVLTPPSAPYLIESSLTLERDGENHYSGSFDGLPDSELTFTLYEKEAITFGDKAEKTVSTTLKAAAYLSFFLWPLLLIILAVVIIAALRRVRRRKGKS